MKKILSFSLLLLVLTSLTACGSNPSKSSAKPSESSKASSVASTPKESTSQSQTSSTSKPDYSSASKAPETSSPTSPTTQTPASSSASLQDDKTDLSQARISLYTAGINSASLTDDQVLSAWREAKAQHIDFISHLKSLYPNL
ncbi:hypothetical protein [Lactococcus termiticola]|uniref:DUF2202 domain-containing protein n=1 Tax=Lactococcus termiticola TaxID=2169526 RepID=A0A2R5HJI3_9LACT|nr:hypothetical protein [Lactococcus termiticola]GBG96758.1 hypothetical protein NtB2_00882 [Lactococcus termiticola]